MFFFFCSFVKLLVYLPNICLPPSRPGAYVIPSAITLKKVGGKRGLVNGIPKNIASFGLTHRPVTVDLDGVAAGLEMYASSSSSSHLQSEGIVGTDSDYGGGERVVAGNLFIISSQTYFHTNTLYSCNSI